FLLLLAFAVVGSLVGYKFWGGKLLGGNSGYKNSDYNFSFDPKLPGWEENVGYKNKIGVSQLVLQRSGVEGYFALDVIDFKDHTPTPRELDDEARRKLKALFTKNLETDPPKDNPPAETEAVA